MLACIMKKLLFISVYVFLLLIFRAEFNRFLLMCGCLERMSQQFPWRYRFFDAYSSKTQIFKKNIYLSVMIRSVWIIILTGNLQHVELDEHKWTYCICNSKSSWQSTIKKSLVHKNTTTSYHFNRFLLNRKVFVLTSIVNVLWSYLWNKINC